MKSELENLIEKWEQEKGSYIPNAPIYQCFIDEAKEALKQEKRDNLEISQQLNELFEIVKSIESDDNWTPQYLWDYVLDLMEKVEKEHKRLN